MIRDDQNQERDLMLLRSYLLGQLGTDEREKLEERLWPVSKASADERSLSELLQVAEDSIIDDYQFGNLSYEDRTDLALRFSWTPLRREKLQLATGLTHVAEAAEAEQVRAPARFGLATTPEGGWAATEDDPATSEAEPWRLAGILPWVRRGEPRRWSMPVWAPAAAALLLVVAIAVSFQVGASRQADSTTAFVAMDPAVRQAGGTPVIAPQGELLRLWLEIGGDYDGYQAELYRSDDTAYLLRTGVLEARPYRDTTAVELLVPSDSLTTGDYYVLLHGFVGADSRMFLVRFNFAITD